MKTLSLAHDVEPAEKRLPVSSTTVERAAQPRPNTEIDGVELNIARLHAYANKVWDNTIADLEAIEAGEDLGLHRNERFMKLCNTLARFMSWGVWDAPAIRDTVEPIAKERNISGWASTLSNCIRWGTGNSRPIPQSMYLDPAFATLRATWGFELRNFDRLEDGEGRSYKRPRDLMAIVADVHRVTSDWPRVVNGQLFAPVEGDHTRVHWLPNSTELSAWLRGYCQLAWVKRAGGVQTVSLGELHSALRHRSSFFYDTVEITPHYPEIQDAYYTRTVEPGDGVALRAFVELLNPDSDFDRWLLEAALITPFWGGQPGTRPAFLLTSDHGPGSGKTSTAQAICKVYGGATRISPSEDWNKVRERLLTDTALKRRCVLVDNVKGRLNLSEIEEAITAASINGRKLYVGDGSRKNYLTWFITANTPSLSRDLAARSVIIKIGSHRHETDFQEVVRAFLETHHEALLGDVLARLREPSRGRCKGDRFRSWQQAVLYRFKEAAALDLCIQERRQMFDDDRAEGAGVAAALLEYIRVKHRADQMVVLRPPEILEALSRVWPHVKSSRALWKRLGPLIGDGELKHVQRLRGGRAGRGISWTPSVRVVPID